MANGSFGLSGLPTAPTSVGSAPNNPFTPVSVAVNSTAGFQAGDLVYNYAGDIAPVPGNAVSTATFPVTIDQAAYVQNVSFGELQSSPVPNGYAQRSGSGCAAKLSNGNIVIVSLRVSTANNNMPYFRIINEAGTVIVAETLIESSQGQFGSITVGALAGGGFAVGWFNQSSTYVRYAIYTNAGAVTVAPTEDTTPGLSNADSWITVVGRPDGSWILAINGSGSNIKHKVYSSTGTQVYAWTTVGTLQSASIQFKYVVRSDGSFVVFNTNVSNQITYTVYSATNTVVVATAVWSTNSPGSSSCWGNATVFSNDTILLTHGNGSNALYTTLTAANSKSATVAYTTPTIGANIYWASAYVLSSGNYILVYVSSLSGGNVTNSYCVSYSFYNSSHTLLSSTYFNGVLSFPINLNFQPAVVETSSFVNIIGSPTGASYTLNSGGLNSSPNQMGWAKISPTTYSVVNSSSASTTLGSTSALPVSGYIRASSTPTSASFLASATSTQSFNQTQGGVVVSQTTIDSSYALAGMDTATLSDGSAVVLYKLSDGSTNAPLKLAIISATGVLVSTTTLIESASLYIGSATSAAYMSFYKIIVLSDGKLAISYLTGAGVPTISILSSTYSILSTITLTPSGTGPNFAESGLSMAALTSARFVVVYQDAASNSPYYRVYDSSLTLLAGPTQVNSNASTITVGVAANRSGFSVTWLNAASSVFSQVFVTENATANTFTISGVTTTSYGGYIYSGKALSGPCGHTYTGYLTGASTLFAVRRAIAGSNQNTNSPNIVSAGSLDSTYAATFAIDNYGGAASFVWNSTSAVNMLYTNSGFVTTSTAATTLTLSLPAITYFRIAAGALAGRNILLLVKNSADFLSYCVITPCAFTNQTSVVSGVTPSNPVAINSSKGFSLIGVSSTAAPANGQGTVVINGPAQLNSNYSASTPGQSFNFQNPVTFGVAGTISGRNVNLIGNV